MKATEYIESGILELYVLGAINSAERTKVDAMAAKYPEVQNAIQALEMDLGNLAQTQNTTPPPSWKEDILKAAISPKAEPIVRSIEPEPLITSGVVKNSSLSFLAIAASLALLISLGANFVQYSSLKQIENSLVATQLRVAELESSNQVMVVNYQNMEQNMSIMRDNNTIPCPLKSVEGRDPSYSANIYWNSSTQMVYLDVKNLPDAPRGKQYQLWALKDGKPIGLGVFDMNNSTASLMEMGQFDHPDAFAVTLEKTGGVESPTMDEMYIYGAPV